MTGPGHTAEALRERSLTFPDDPGLGLIWLPSTGFHKGGWENRGRAQGKVTIDPPHQRVRVELTEKAASRPGSLSFLASWDPFGVQELHLESGSVNDETLAGLAHLVGLESLHFQSTHVTARGLRSLGSLPRLATLTLVQCPVQDDVFAVVADFPSLSKLWLTDCPITGQGLRELARAARLRALGITRAPLEQASMAGLSALLQLQELGCSETPLTDAVLGQLEPLRHLEVLRAAQVALTTHGVLQLKRRLPRLREVELRTLVGPRHGILDHGSAPALWTGWAGYFDSPASEAGAGRPAKPVATDGPVPADRISNLDAVRQALPASALQQAMRTGCALAGSAGTARLDLFYEKQYKQRLPALITSDALVGLLPVFVAELRLQAAAVLYPDLQAFVSGMLQNLRGAARSAFLVADRILSEDPLRPRIEALLQRVLEFSSDSLTTANGRPYHNWPAREHYDEWWKLTHDNREIFDELKLEKSWPARRDVLIAALHHYLERPQPDIEADPMADAERQRIAAAVPALCELTGQTLDYGRVAASWAHSEKVRKYDQVVHWLQLLEWGADQSAGASIAHTIRVGTTLDNRRGLRDLWERIFMLESLLSDASGPTLVHDPAGSSVFGRRVNPWREPIPRAGTEVGNFPQVWGWMLQGLLEDAGAPDAPAFMRTALWRNKTAATVMAGVLLAADAPARPALRLDETEGSDRTALEAWVEPVPRFLERLDAWFRTVQVALNALDLSSFDLNVRLTRLHALIAIMQSAIERQRSGRYHSVAECQELNGLAYDISSTLCLQPRFASDMFQLVINHEQVPGKQVALGLWERVVAACPQPDGTVVLAAGAVLPVFEVPLDWSLETWSLQQLQDPNTRLKRWRPSHG